MKIKFFGTRGSIPTPGQKYAKYGGNTTCLEVLTNGGEEYIFDAGSGIRELGNELMARGFAPGKNGKAKIFLTHKHWDHIQGLPFFVPAYIPTNDLVVYGQSDVNASIRDILSNQMIAPYFPVPMEVQRGLKGFVDLKPGKTLENGVAIGYWNGNHPNGSLVYAMREGDKKMVFASDYEHDGQLLGKRFGPIDDELVKFARGADVLVMDAQYTPEEYTKMNPEDFSRKVAELEAGYTAKSGKRFSEMGFLEKAAELWSMVPGIKVGWGHSTYEKAIDIAQAAGVKQLLLTHHDPSHTDEQLDKILERAQNYLAANYSGSRLQVGMAYDGLDIKI